MKLMEKIKSKKLSKVILGSIIAAGIAVPQIAGASSVAVYIGTGEITGLDLKTESYIQTVTGKVATNGVKPINVKDSYSGSGSAINLDKETKNITGLSRDDDSKNMAYVYIDCSVNLATVSGVYGNAVRNAANGTIVFRNGGVSDFVYGGLANGGDISTGENTKDAINNIVTIESSNTSEFGDVIGGKATGNVKNNEINIFGGIKFKNIKGGSAHCGDAINNIVTITSTQSFIAEAIMGGYSFWTNAKENVVRIENGTVDSKVWGGYSEGYTTTLSDVNVESNKVIISGGTVKKDVYGGLANRPNIANVKNNEVEISGTSTSVEQNVLGAWILSDTKTANASGNHVIVTGGTVKETVFGVNSDAKGDATLQGNYVKITGGTVLTLDSGNICGAYTKSNGTFTGNYVTIGEVGSSNTINVAKGLSDTNICGVQTYAINKGTIKENYVKINSGNVVGNIFGAYVGENVGAKNDVSENYVEINGGNVGILAGYEEFPLAHVYGAGAIYSDVKNNRVDIKGGNIRGLVLGAWSQNGNADGNSVNISGGTFGTESSHVTIYSGSSETGIVRNNSVNISGGDLKYATICGYKYGEKYDKNTLNFFTTNGSGKQQYQGGDINSISNFTTINFGDLSEALLNNTNQTNGYIKINDGSLNYTILTANSVAASGYLLTGSFSAYGVTLGGALSSNAVETVTTVEDDSVKVGTTSTSVTFGDKTSLALTTNYVHVSVGDIKYDMMAGKYIDASGKESGSGTLTLSATPDAAIKTVAGVYSNDISKVATGGTLNLSGGTYAVDVKVYGGYSDGGTVTGNNLNISGGTFNFTGENNGHIYGGSTYKGTAEGNIIDISGADTVIYKYIYGGHGKNANKNEVKISNGTLNGVVYGSRVNDGEATENSVQISGGTINSVVYGGYSLHIGDSSTSKANDNKVVISGGTINSYVVGGAGYEAKDNKIIIKQGIDKAASLVNARLEGNSKETMNATDNNSLIIENLGAGTIIGSVKNFNSISFGDVALGDISYLTINDGSLNGTVITAGKLTGEGDLISGVSTTGVNVEALKGEAGKDKITALTNGVQYAVGGGTEVTVNAKSIHVKANAPDTVKALTGVFYGDDGKAEKGITDGVLTLDGSVDPADDVIYAGAYAKKGKASGGTVKLTGNFNGTVYGGYSADGNGAENNTLEIDGSKSVTVNKIEAVDTINITGKVAKNGEKAVLNVTNKADFTKANVNIEGLALTDASNGDVYKVISNASVDAAKVVIKNLAKVDGNVVKANIITKDVQDDKLTLTYGGKVVTGSYTDEAGTVATKDGVLRVSDIDKFVEGVIYTGAYSSNGTANGTVDLDNSFAGTLYGYYQANGENGSGTLNVRGKDLVVKKIANFNTINFFVPADMPKDGTVLKVESEVNIAGAKVNAGINNQSALDIGDEITLLEAVSLDATGIVAGKVTENDFIDYDMNIEATEKELKAKITSKGISNENSKSPVETIAGSLVMLNMGAEQLAGKGFESAAEAVASEKATAPNCMTPFASIGGNKVKAETGSHIDIKGWNFNLGFAKEIDNKSGKLLIAPLVEYGRGTYDSYVENNIGVVHADGTSKYWGAGMMARQTNENGFYYEGSLVGGKSTNDYSTKDIGRGISYETSAMYITAHLGAGKIVEVTDKDKLNFYGKFFYSRLGSDDTTLSNGAKYSFDTSESKRMRIGGRLTRELNEKNKLYAGMAWQYEFDAESRATVNGKTAQAPTMKGHTGILELGWKVKPGNSKFDVDLSFLGYTGKHKGGSINVNMNWNF